MPQPNLNDGYIVQALESNPGYNRDSPLLEGTTFSDGDWNRFYAKNPRKMGGMEKILSGTDEPVRAMYQCAVGNFTRVFLFRDTGVSQVDFYPDGTITSELDRTPTDWVVPPVGTPSLTFSVDSYTLYAVDSGITSQIILFLAPPNSENPSQTTEVPLYFAPADSTENFISAGVSASGGVVVSTPYIMVYGNDGLVKTNDGLSPFVWSGTGTYQFIVTNSKVLGAKEFRGGVQFWSIDTLFLTARNTNGDGFVTTVLAPDISLLSPSSIVTTHNNTVVWVGNDQFYVYNGVAQPIVNTFNHNLFFDNVNQKYKGKVWGMYVGKYQEIWFFNVENAYTEPNRVFIYKLDENYWYDATLSRTCGLKQKFLDYPLLADAKPNPFNPEISYSIWAHEKGYDLVHEGVSYPIKSFFQTRIFDAFAENPMTNLNMIIRKLEPDLIQKGDMTVEVLTYQYPKSPPVISKVFTFAEAQKTEDINVQGRYISFRFTSNTLGGFYQMGMMQVNYQLGGVTP